MLAHKFKLLGKIGLEKNDLKQLMLGLDNIDQMTNAELTEIYNCNIKFADNSIDSDPTK
jgi:hypothetical protein